jgi:hypothetical protein
MDLDAAMGEALCLCLPRLTLNAGRVCWLVNKLRVGSPVAALMEGLLLVSNLVGYYRHYGFEQCGTWSPFP